MSLRCASCLLARDFPVRVLASRFFKRCPSPSALQFVTAGLLMSAAVQAAPPPAPVAKPLGCLIEPDRVADIGSQVVGIVERLDVKRGDSVAQGQLLATLRADVERANASAAQTRASVDAEVLAAKAGVELGEQKLRRAEALLAQNFVSDQAVELVRNELEVARQKLNQVRAQQRIWAEERRVAEAQLALRTVRSPFAGVVVERFVNPGERVEDRPLMRMAVIDPLRVELMVPTAQFGSLAVGDKVAIRPELAGAGAVAATVRHVDKVLDAASNSFRVQLTLPNPGYRLPAGLRCKAELAGGAAGSAPSSSTSLQLKLDSTLTWPRPAAPQRSPL